MTSIHNLFFQQSNDPGFIIDRANHRLVEVNQAFAELTGWSQAELDREQITTRQLIHPDDRDAFEVKIANRPQVERDRYSIRLLDRAGQSIHVEISVATVAHGDSVMLVGTLRDISPQKRLERTLQNEITRQRNMTYKAAQASVRIGQVLEKLRSVPALARELLSSQSRDTLLANVVTELTAGDKFSYSRVAIYAIDAGQSNLGKSDLGKSDTSAALAVHCVADSRDASSVHDSREERNPDADQQLVQRAITTGELQIDGRLYVIPMQNRTEIAGALLIQFHAFEKNLFDENATIRRAQEDTVKTIGNLVGLGLENLELYERLHEQALADQLTGVHNRRYFEMRLAEVSSGEVGQGESAVLVLLDVDHFKNINDEAGHVAGDDVLVRIALLLQRHFAEAYAICRVGGDEFAVLAPGAVERVAAAADRFRQEVAAAKWRFGATGHGMVSVSIGVAPLDRDSVTRGWLVEVDRALYAAKQAGRNRVQVAAPLC